MFASIGLHIKLLRMGDKTLFIKIMNQLFGLKAQTFHVGAKHTFCGGVNEVFSADWSRDWGTHAASSQCRHEHTCKWSYMGS